MTEECDREDREVVKSVLAGNRNAFRRLVERYQPVVSSLGRRLIRSSADVPDYVQEVFLKAFSRLSQYSGAGRFYSWLVRIAYTTAINRSERAVPEVAMDPEVLDRAWRAGRDEDPERQTFRNAILEALSQAIAELPEHFAVAVELFFFADLRYSEISKMTGVPPNTLKSHVFRARLLLREKLNATIAEDYHEL
jgi:RNA polymerase sigma-70 factor (ECF subfamily)